MKRKREREKVRQEERESERHVKNEQNDKNNVVEDNKNCVLWLTLKLPMYTHRN